MLETMFEDSAPQSVGGYRLQRRLGAGGSGTVWLAEDEANTPVALKLLHPTVAATEEGRHRLIREARLVNQIPGTGIARVLDYEADDLTPFIVTEFIEGETLAQVVAEQPLSLAEAAYLAELLRDLLGRVHSAGIAHRDLKPSNIIISDHGPVLIDFGIAQGDADDRLTQTGLVTGTPGFVSPELMAGGPHIPFEQWQAGDWWAWSALLLSSLTGQPPFGTGAPEVIAHRMYQGQPELSLLPPELQPHFRLALAVNPKFRPEPIKLVHALEQAQQAGPTSAPVDPTAALLSPTGAPDPTLLAPYPSPQPSPGPIPEPILPYPGPGNASSTPWPPAQPGGTPWEPSVASFAPVVPPEPKSIPGHSPIQATAILMWLALLPTYFGTSGFALVIFMLALLAIGGEVRVWIDRRLLAGGRATGTSKFLYFPRHTVMGMLQLIPGLALGMLAGLVGLMIASGSVSDGISNLTSWVASLEPDTVNPVATWALALLVLAVTYLTPSSAPLRWGLRYVVHSAVPNRWYRELLGLALIALAVGLVALLMNAS